MKEREEALKRADKEAKVRAKMQADLEEMEQAAAEIETEPAEPAKAEVFAEEELPEQGEIEEQDTGSCDCCGTEDIPVGDLTKIDSGHLFCTTCLKELRGA
jgi:hypothetical protein